MTELDGAEIGPRLCPDPIPQLWSAPRDFAADAGVELVRGYVVFHPSAAA